MSTWESTSPAELASAFDVENNVFVIHNTDSERAICRKYTNLVHQAPPEYILAFARELLFTHGHRWQAYEVITAHKGAFRSLGVDELEELGLGINSWWSVDSFARTLSGPAWRDGLVSDELIVKWAGSPALWWALRELVYFDTEAVEGFVKEHENVLAGRVKREVVSKLRTGLKNPRR